MIFRARLRNPDHQLFYFCALFKYTFLLFFTVLGIFKYTYLIAFSKIN